MTLKTSNQPILEVLNISKRFDMTQALSNVSLKMYPGEIHALVGENGAGKSTLIKILTGVQQADQGELRLSGAPKKLRPTVLRLSIKNRCYFQTSMLQKIFLSAIKIMDFLCIGTRCTKKLKKYSVVWESA